MIIERLVSDPTRSITTEFDISVPRDLVFAGCQLVNDEPVIWFDDYLTANRDHGPDETQKFKFYRSDEKTPESGEYMATVVFKRWGALHLFWLQ